MDPKVVVFGRLQKMENCVLHGACAIDPRLCCSLGDLDGGGSGCQSSAEVEGAYFGEEWKVISNFKVHFQILRTPQE